MNRPQPEASAPILILYDGRCGLCSGLAHFWRRVLRRYGFELLPLQDERVRAHTALSTEMLLRDMHLLQASGAAVAGADVYRFVARTIWWLYPLYLLSVLPGLRALVDRVYRLLADRRRALSRLCRWDL